MYTKYKVVPFCLYHFVHTILSATILSVYHFVRTILSATILSEYHFVRTILSATILSGHHLDIMLHVWLTLVYPQTCKILQLCHRTVLNQQNNSCPIDTSLHIYGQNGTDKMVWLKYYG